MTGIKPGFVRTHTHSPLCGEKPSGGEIISLVQDIAADISPVFKAVDLVILDIGTNDLNNDYNFHPRSLCLVLMDLVEHLLGSGVCRVLASEIIFRRGWLAPGTVST